MFNLVIFGAPGSGKGTQSAMIAKRYHFAHISTGDIFRSEIKNKTPLGMRVKEVIDSGQLVSDELLMEIIENAMAKASNPDGFIFDGFPRTLRQARDMDAMLHRHKTCVSLVLALDVNREEIISRLLNRAQEQGRVDDTEAVIRKRLEVYQNQTSPLIDYYKNQSKFTSINGVGTLDGIFAEICHTIDPHLADAEPTL
ncbi:MAG: adenylate kinase [Clostridia bacterium]|nr:adenylate kinase [Clostridia bacterium]